MLNYFCEVTLECDDGKIRTYRCCGFSQADAEKKLLREFSGCKILCSVVLHTYDD